MQCGRDSCNQLNVYTCILFSSDTKTVNKTDRNRISIRFDRSVKRSDCTSNSAIRMFPSFICGVKKISDKVSQASALVLRVTTKLINYFKP